MCRVHWIRWLVWASVVMGQFHLLGAQSCRNRGFSHGFSNAYSHGYSHGYSVEAKPANKNKISIPLDDPDLIKAMKALIFHYTTVGQHNMNNLMKLNGVLRATRQDFGVLEYNVVFFLVETDCFYEDYSRTRMVTDYNYDEKCLKVPPGQFPEHLCESQFLVNTEVGVKIEKLLCTNTYWRCEC